MPLLDHFHPPLYPQRAWESFHSRWANSIADELHRVLPDRYFAEVHIHLGGQVEADVAEFDRAAAETGNGAAGGVAVQTWAPPAAVMTMPAAFPDDMEVQVRDQTDDARLVAVVELVSPRNKDRDDSRPAFAAKCAAYLQRGVGLVVIDVVTSRQSNLHNEMIRMMNWGDTFLLPADALLYAAAYRPVRRQNVNQIDVWPSALTLGQALPQLPLALRGGPAVPLKLEASYADACQRSRI
ncbi:MAG TPA: DUF4058 family protein [Gemmataceae bacterium]|nr:DUF4058 family protein [Gemmataceae bacterium]